MKSIGIDPAPGKESTVCKYEDGNFKFCHLNARKLQEELGKMSGDTLVCWDAPLTMGDESDISKKGVFTRRKVEKIFASKINKPPKGISVQGYSGCQHWTISQYLVGYPKVFQGDLGQRKFTLIHKKEELSNNAKPFIAEVHPAVAIWFWMLEYGISFKEMYYKGNKKNKETWDKMLEILATKLDCPIKDINSDDELDAWVAWKLGDLLIKDRDNETNNVDFLGSEKEGSFLLPGTAKLKNYKQKLCAIGKNNS